MRAGSDAMRVLAEQRNVACKISGLGQPGQPWTVASNGRVVLDTIEIFGVDRCMFASNFPVDSLVADFDTIFDGFKTIVAGSAQPSRRRCSTATPSASTAWTRRRSHLDRLGRMRRS